MILCACVLAFPSLNRKERNDELETIIETLRKEFRLSENTDNFNKFSNTEIKPLEEKAEPSFGNLGHFASSDTAQSNDIFDNDSDSFTEVKRQGSWDYDYGLGGGRFGKRAGKSMQRVRRPYDYFSVGGFGGRFGRDTDHVTQLENDFEDSTEYE